MNLARKPPKYEIGVDIGGTFTDWVLWHPERGIVRTGKLLTTEDVASGFLLAVDRAIEGLDRSEIVAVRHATTIATNALVQRNMPRLVLFSTKGFRDVLEIGRHVRKYLYDLDQEKPPPLVPRQDRIEIEERVDSQGRVLTPLNEDEVRRWARFYAEDGCRDFAIAYLHSYANPTHEERTAELILSEIPNAQVSTSSGVWRQYREFERTSTCVVSAAVGPAVTSYVRLAEEGLRARGISAPLLIMTSAGGLVPGEWVTSRPVHVVESGPAAGAIAAGGIGAATGQRGVIGLDIGGTTAKATFLEDGAPQLTQSYKVGGDEHGAVRREGYPVGVPVIDLVEVGAGGGSIAFVDEAGSLQVGPRSAGANPGPACYGLGGREPTVTDANLVLGRIVADRGLSGLKLHVEAATNVMEEKIAAPLGISVEEAAAAIIKIANSRTYAALRRATIERGRDARSHALVVTGGAGPLHACDLAEELGISTIIIPPHSGVASAIGLLEAPLRWDAQLPIFARSDSDSPRRLVDNYRSLQDAVRQRLAGYGVHPAEIKVSCYADARYVGQSYEVSVEIPPVALQGDVMREIVRRFHDEHRRLYLHSTPDRPVEVVNARASATSRVGSKTTRASTASHGAAPASVAALASGAKRDGGRPVVARRADVRRPVAGPAVLTDDDCTIFVGSGWGAVHDEGGNLWLAKRRRQRTATSPARRSTGRDVVTREVVRYGLESIAERMAAVVERTAHSTIIREILDYATAIFDTKGRLIGQSSRLPFDHNSMSTTLATILERWKPLDQWRPGDVILTNDPYLAGSQHLPDLQVFMPLFYESGVVGVAGCVGHHVDVGGSVPGSYSVESVEIFEEGLRLPPVLLYSEGRPVEDTWNILLANIRLPETVRGDLGAQVASLRVAEHDIVELISRVGLKEILAAEEELLDYSEMMMRLAIQRMPDGTYSFRDALDDDGKTPDPVEIVGTITISGDEVVVDFTGSASQRPAQINATYAMALSSVYYVFIAVAGSHIPQNDGCYRPIRVIAPEGTVVNSKSPAPVVGRIATCHRIVDTLFGALAQALPEKIPAAFYGMSNIVSITGIDEETGERWISFEIGVGGWGGRAGSDGPDALAAHLHNVLNTPVEVVERTFPLMIERYELIPDSGGAGEFRGGLGTLRSVRLVTGEAAITVQSDRFRIPPYGLQGGRPGRTGSFTILRREGEEEKMRSKATSVPLRTGDVLRIETQGGGGFGDPTERSRAAIKTDLLEGKITETLAVEAYDWSSSPKSL